MHFFRAIFILVVTLALSSKTWAGTPVATTGAATNVGDLTATLHGVVNTGNNVTYNSFDFGTTASYGRTINTTPLTAGCLTDEPLTANLTFCLPNTTYHYRLVCWDPYNNVNYYGADRTFTTGVPNTPPSFDLGGLVATTTTMNLGASNIRAGSSPATLSLEYSLTTSYGTTYNWTTPVAMDEVANRVPPTLGALIRDRAASRCEYCQLPEAESEEPFEIEHVIAIKHHGETADHNLAFACMNCNGCKGTNPAGTVPETGELVRLYHPRIDDWEEHFRFDPNGVISGRTKVGLVTVDVLRMNLPHLVNRRRVLMEAELW